MRNKEKHGNQKLIYACVLSYEERERILGGHVNSRASQRGLTPKIGFNVLLFIYKGKQILKL